MLPSHLSFLVHYSRCSVLFMGLFSPRDLELAAFSGVCGFDNVMPLLDETITRLKEDLWSWVSALQAARRLHPFLCFTPTRQLPVLMDGFSGVACDQDHFQELLSTIHPDVKVTKEITSGLAITDADRHNAKCDNEATLRALGRRLDEVVGGLAYTPRKLAGFDETCFQDPSQSVPSTVPATLAAGEEERKHGQGEGGEEERKNNWATSDEHIEFALGITEQVTVVATHSPKVLRSCRMHVSAGCTF